MPNPLPERHIRLLWFLVSYHRDYLRYPTSKEMERWIGTTNGPLMSMLGVLRRRGYIWGPTGRGPSRVFRLTWKAYALLELIEEASSEAGRVEFREVV